MKKILVIGARGMAGHIVLSYLKSAGEYIVHGVARGISGSDKIFDVDVSDTDKLQSIVADNKYDVVVNCIGLLNKTAEDNPDKAVWYNSYFPHLLEAWGIDYDFKLVHISTDCVFSGKEGGYTESSFKNGIGFYAQSKALGEVINERDLTIRTSIIGPELKENGIGLLHWFLNQTGKVSGYTKAYWTGVTTLELAKAIHASIQQDIKGLYHLVNNDKISKFELLQLFNTIFREGQILIEPNEDYRIDKSLINNREDFNYQIPSYSNMIYEMKQWIDISKSSYTHYGL